MESEFALKLIREMVEIPSVSGNEERLAAYLCTQMEHLGLRSRIDGAGNVVGEIGPANGPVVMLLGHMDTVHGHMAVRQESRLLYGRGSVDAKGSLATFICAAAAAQASARVVVVGAVEEETLGSRGARYLFSGHDPEVILIGEPSGWSHVTLGYKGQLGIRYTVQCPQVHEAAAGDNAAALAVEFWRRVEEHLAEIDPEKSAFHRPIPNLRRIQGDPEQATVGISCRLPPGFGIPVFQEQVRAIAGDGELVFDAATPAVLMDRTALPVRCLVAAIRRQGVQPGLKVKTGTSDMNTVSERWKVPMAAYGPGDSRLDHTPDEHLDLDELLRAIAVLSDALPPLARELLVTAEASSDDEEEQARDKSEGNDGSHHGDTGESAEEGQEELVWDEEAEEELGRRLRALGYIS